MIFGVGTDIVSLPRMRDYWERYGERGMDKILASVEKPECLASNDPARFLAKRFAAKEAFAKALGTGVRAPAVMPALAVTHDALGRPGFSFDDALSVRMTSGGLTAHLSLSDEFESVIAFVVLEQRDRT